MAYGYVTSRFGGTGSAGNTILSSYVINAGETPIIVGCNFAASGSTLTLTDGTNTYTSRGTGNDTRNGLTFTLFDCIGAIPGTYTLTLTGAGTGGGFWTNNYTGLTAFSAGSFASFFSGASPPITTDGCTTSVITPSSYAAMILGIGTCDGTLTAGTGFTARATASSGPAFSTEDLRLTSGSNIASYTMTTGGTDVVILGAAYLETPVVIPPTSYFLESTEYF